MCPSLHRRVSIEGGNGIDVAPASGHSSAVVASSGSARPARSRTTSGEAGLDRSRWHVRPRLGDEAAFATLNQDIFSVPTVEISSTVVTGTWVRGDKEFVREQWPRCWPRPAGTDGSRRTNRGGAWRC